MSTVVSRVANAKLESIPAVIVRLDRDVSIVLSDGSSRKLRTRKGRAMLAVLALADGNAASRKQLTSILWSGIDRETASKRFRSVLHDTKRELAALMPGLLVLLGDNIQLNPALVQVDVGAKNSNPGYAVTWSRFLADLDEVDPSFDRWLTITRSEKTRSLLGCSKSEIQARGNVSAPSSDDDRPIIIVTKFEHLGFGQNEYYEGLLTDEVASALARFRWYRFVTRDDRGERLTIGQQTLMGRGHYALYGTLRHGQDQDKLFVKLTSLHAAATVVWSETFDLMHSPPAKQWDRFINSVAARLDAEMLAIESDRRRSRPWPDGNRAYSLMLRAMPAIFRLERGLFNEAGDLLREAVELDPESSIAHIALAHWHVFHFGQGWTDKPVKTLEAALGAADRATAIDPNDARALTIAGHVRAFLHRRLEEALALHRLALELNPALALAWHYCGMTHAYAGRLNDAHTCIVESRELAANDPMSFYSDAAVTLVHLLRHEHDQAVITGRLVTERKPTFTSGYKPYLSALGHLGRRTDAALVLKRLLEVEPRFTLAHFRATTPYKRPEDVEHFITGLRLAGVT